MSVTRFMYVFVWYLIITQATSTNYCGTVDIKYKNSSEEVDGILQLVPSQNINIAAYKFRWYFYNSSEPQYPLRTSVSQVEPLTVRNIGPRDFGTYSLDCWIIDTSIHRYQQYKSRNEVVIDRSSLIAPIDSAKFDPSNDRTSTQCVTTTMNINEKSLPLPSTDSIVIIVFIVTVMIIVVAITVIIKLKKRRLSADKRRVASLQTGSSNNALSGEINHDYQEIEEVDVGDTYNRRLIGNTSMELGVFDNTYVNEVAIQQHTYPPVREGDCMHGSTRILQALGPYNTDQSIGTATSGSVYATIAPKSQRSKLHTDIPNMKCGSTFTVSTGVRDEYASVLPRSQRSQQFNNETNNNASDNTVDVLNGTERVPESQKFEMVKPVPDEGHERSTHTSCTLSASTTPLSPLHANSLHIYAIPDGCDELVKDIHFPIRRSDSSKSVNTETYYENHVLCRRFSMSEGSGLDYVNGYITPVFVPCHKDGSGALVYVDVDHGECGVDLANQYDLAINMSNDTPCAYSTIDINKKAFIAPLRRAPSSWYKRKQNRKGNC